ncbi:Homocysteine S-methyltransferase [Fomitiporia mediterranea MF3/22]|uniref:Homocysteine S-methyltransferase n=1 Tax=Fomitiporia mediterranea (strain MF3/22) TaxID=694068 RepID=UPI000440942B|nr:Homocysteine S-methyltransferase [Fomitiporia mediterranea MF3/22]EJD02563.1 Homocysteine S-methyltransferase [Fomitiporia mediterranea MF3/22]
MAFTSGDEILLLDGGFGTTLEDVFQKDISSPLWSASLVEKEPDVIIKAHSEFLNAGSDIILTATYQCSFKTFDRAGYSRPDAINLMRKTVQLATQARDLHQQRKQAKVVLSLGPFGAALTTAQEFDGIYPPPYGPRAFSANGPNTNAFHTAVSEEAAILSLRNFHYDRLRVFAMKKDDEVWNLIDGIAFETIPLAREVKAIRLAMARLNARLREWGQEEKPWWISTVWPSGVHPQESGSGDRLSGKDVAEALLLPDSTGDLPVPSGVGINCTHIKDLDEVVSKLRRAIDEIKPNRKPSLVLYPNGGGVYDIVKRTWTKPEGEEVDTEEFHISWAQRLVSIAKREQETGSWGGTVIGGCCKTTPAHINLLAKSLGRGSE